MATTATTLSLNVVDFDVMSSEKTSSNGTKHSTILYRLIFDTSFPGFVVKRNERIATDINYFDFRYDQIITILTIAHKQFKFLTFSYTEKGEKVPSSLIFSLLNGAKITIERTFHQVGDEYHIDDEVLTYENDGYTTSVKEVELSPKMASVLDKKIEAVMSI